MSYREKSVRRIGKCSKHYDVPDEPETVVKDMLADLRHYCEAKGLDFGSLSVLAEDYHKDEVSEDMPFLARQDSCPNCNARVDLAVGSNDGLHCTVTCTRCCYRWHEADEEHEPETVVCKFCNKDVPADTAHLHQDGWVGDECCWDERLRITEQKMASYKVTLREIHTVVVDVEAPVGTSTAELMQQAAAKQSYACWPTAYEELADWDTWDCRRVDTEDKE